MKTFKTFVAEKKLSQKDIKRALASIKPPKKKPTLPKAPWDDKEQKEAKVDELNKSTLANYVKKASDDRAKNAYDVGKSGEINYKGLKRRQGINRAVNKLAKEETLDEVLDRPGALDSYRKKADASGNKARNSATRKILTAPKDGKRPDHSDELKTMKKRNKGQDMADRVANKQFRKSIGLGYNAKKEEVEQVDEISNKKMGQYVRKATDDAARRAMDAGEKAGRGDSKGFGKQMVKSRQRVKGVQKAMDKMDKNRLYGRQ